MAIKNNMKLVISVSGGGALGIGPLQFMRRLEADLGKKLGDLSSAFAGTSTGSIVASGLCNGMSAEELYKIYEDGLPSIFKKKSGVPILQSKYVQYENTGLKKLLYKYFPKKMDQYPKPMFIATTCLDGDSVEKVWDRGDAWLDQAYAVMTSCSAPTYFEVLPLKMKSKVTGEEKTFHFCDGGMWANDPIMILQSGVNNIKDFGKYKILAFNTTMDTPNEMPKSQNALGWLSYVMNDWIARAGNSNYYEACANVGKSNVFRCSPKSNKIAMDDLTQLKKVSDLWNRYYDSVKDDVLKFLKNVE